MSPWDFQNSIANEGIINIAGYCFHAHRVYKRIIDRH